MSAEATESEDKAKIASQATGPSDVNPPQEMIAAAAEEMRREIPQFMPIGLVVGGLFILVGILVVAALMLG